VKESERLNSLTETHLIGQNDVPIFVPRLDQPVDTSDLVWLKSLALFIPWESVYFWII